MCLLTYFVIRKGEKHVDLVVRDFGTMEVVKRTRLNSRLSEMTRHLAETLILCHKVKIFIIA